MSDQSLALYTIIGRRELLATLPEVAAPGFTKELLPRVASPDALWAELQGLPSWETVAPGYQGCFSLGGDAYVSAQLFEGKVTFALNFGETYVHDAGDIQCARQTLANFEQLLAYLHSIPGCAPKTAAHHNESNDEGDGHE